MVVQMKTLTTEQCVLAAASQTNAIRHAKDTDVGVSIQTTVLIKNFWTFNFDLNATILKVLKRFRNFHDPLRGRISNLAQYYKILQYLLFNTILIVIPN